MAVAAYAAVLSLIDVLDRIQEYSLWHRLRLDRKQIQALQQKVSFLQEFLEVHSPRFYAGLESLARQVTVVAAEAEEIIDAYVVDQLISQISANEKLVGDEEEDIIDCHGLDQLDKGSAEGIDNVIEKINSFKKELMMIKEGMAIQELGPKASNPSRSSTPPSSSNNTMIGFDDRLAQVIDELIGDICDLRVLPIVGMGGIGKTTLARNAYDNSYIRRHFDKHTWFTVSQDYSTRGILLGLLKELDYPKYMESNEGVAELGGRLHQILYDRRYLVVMDDVWDIQVWNDLRSFFPKNSNGSRIMVTTRLSPVAVSLSSQTPYRMDFLDVDNSWDLFCMKAFGKDGRCPPELEEVGKSIAKHCKGLPLAIVVIGGMLSKSNMTREAWECVAKDVNSFANLGDNEHCLKILSLSYNQLPIHLKSCFLYMREFNEGEDIPVSKIITLWVAGGFVKPIEDKTLEEVAKEYLEDLNDRNLILASRLGINEKIKTCRMHDILRDLCIREFEKEQFYCVPKGQIVNGKGRDFRIKGGPSFYCFLCCRLVFRGFAEFLQGARIDLHRVVVSSKQTSPARCFVCVRCTTKYPQPQLNKLRLVKVLDTRSYGRDILHPTRLRVLSLTGKFHFVDGLMPLLWNLQSLDITCYRDVIVLPSEIWELPQLRHLNIRHRVAILPEPPLITEAYGKDSTVLLKNLQTLSNIHNFKWSNDAIERLLNLKKLKIHYGNESDGGLIEWSYYSLHNLDRLSKLESLCLSTKIPLKKNITFPQSLNKLSLEFCKISWEEMTTIGSLPNLEVLKLSYEACKGPEWNPVEGEFLQLKKLRISGCWSLKRWGAEKVHFPSLENFELSAMHDLVEIPSGIGEIETLHSIRLSDCTPSVINSAKVILEEQHSLGNEDFQLYVDRKLVLPASE